MAVKNVAKAKIATMIDDTNIAINVGSVGGVRQDDLVTVNKRIEVIDPDTKTSLGNVLVAKLRLKVTMVTEKYSVATVITRVGSASDPWSTKVLGGTKEVTLNPAEEDENVVLIAIGDEVLVTRTEEEPTDEPPF